MYMYHLSKYWKNEFIIHVMTIFEEQKFKFKCNLSLTYIYPYESQLRTLKILHYFKRLGYIVDHTV